MNVLRISIQKVSVTISFSLECMHIGFRITFAALFEM